MRTSSYGRQAERPAGAGSGRGCLPTFLILGAAKAGTTALHSYLAQHPEVFVAPVKEPNFFAYDGRRPGHTGPGDERNINRHSVTNLDEYCELFEFAPAGAQRGEASPVYLYWPGTAARIRALAPGAKLIALLRNPIERAWSNYLHLRRDGREPEPSFEAALAAEERRRTAGWEYFWHYRAVGRYGEQLERYYALFPRAQIKVILHEDFDRDSAAVVAEVFQFLGVDPGFTADTSKRPNEGGVPVHSAAFRYASHHPRLRRAVRAVVPSRLRPPISRRLFDVVPPVGPRIEPAVWRDLADCYRADVARLGELIGRDLSGWLEPRGA